ncbi:MAG: hypothetical protein VW270_26230, partial [Candidatus Poseidoniales archaeon]
MPGRTRFVAHVSDLFASTIRDFAVDERGGDERFPEIHFQIRLPVNAPIDVQIQCLLFGLESLAFCIVLRILEREIRGQ